MQIEQIRQAVASRRKEITVPVPAWGGEVKLRQMSAAQYFDVCASLPKAESGAVELRGGANVADFYIRVIGASAVNEDCSPLFATDDDLALLYASPQAIAVLGPAAMELNGLAGKEGDSPKN